MKAIAFFLKVGLWLVKAAANPDASFGTMF